jgi:NO-binding membrane sensor protein with MHYT domain
MIARIFVVAGIVAGTLLMLLAWVIPTWPYDWVPPSGAQKDADLAYFDLICASASIIIVIAAALLNFKVPAGRLRPISFAIGAVVVTLAIARLALLLFSSQPWPDFR